MTTATFVMAATIPSALSSSPLNDPPERYVCESLHIFQGRVDNDHRGFSLSVGYNNNDSSRDLLAGGMEKLWEAALEDWPATNYNSIELYPSSWGDGYENGTCKVNLLSIRIVGEVPGDLFGYSVAFVGDIAGTSGEDFVVGAPAGSLRS